MTKLKIKISSIKHLTDARYFSSREVDYLGFDRLSTATNDVKLIQEWIYGPQITSEFLSHNNEEEVQDLLSEHATDSLHFGVGYGIEMIHHFSDYELFYDVDLDILDVDAINGHLNKAAEVIDYFVLKSSRSFVELKDLLTKIISNYPCFLDIPFSATDLKSIIAISPEGIILRGGEEDLIGIKSFDELDEIFDKLEMIED